MRLFVAFLFDESVLNWLGKVQDGLQHRNDGVRWIGRPQLHMTVKFLGEVRDDDVNRVAEAMQRGSEKGGSFTLELGGCGCFPPRGPVRIVWVGSRDSSGTMLRTVEAVNTEIERLGYPSENRPWSPHITIGRVREDRTRGALRAAVEGCEVGVTRQSVGSITLMSSELSPKGARYTPVHTAELS